jgi:antitoxin HigA-1
LTITEGMTMRTVLPVSPGEMLEEEFLKPLGLTKYRLAKDIGVPAQRIGEIVSGKRSVTADTDLRLCRYFGLSDGWWLRGQVAYDTAIAKESLQKELASIQKCSLLAA